MDSNSYYNHTTAATANNNDNNHDDDETTCRTHGRGTDTREMPTIAGLPAAIDALRFLLANHTFVVL